jgi:hypothetical protein
VTKPPSLKSGGGGDSDPCCLESVVLCGLCFWEAGRLMIGRREAIPFRPACRRGGTSQTLTKWAEWQGAEDPWVTICLLC